MCRLNTTCCKILQTIRPFTCFILALAVGHWWCQWVAGMNGKLEQQNPMLCFLLAYPGSRPLITQQWLLNRVQLVLIDQGFFKHSAFYRVCFWILPHDLLKNRFYDTSWNIMRISSCVGNFFFLSGCPPPRKNCVCAREPRKKKRKKNDEGRRQTQSNQHVLHSCFAAHLSPYECISFSGAEDERVERNCNESMRAHVSSTTIKKAS